LLPIDESGDRREIEARYSALILIKKDLGK